MIDKSKLKELALAATPGPWERGSELTIACEDGSKIARLSSTRGKYEYEEVNANWIAAANPAAILELLAELESVHTSALKEAEKACTDLLKPMGEFQPTVFGCVAAIQSLATTSTEPAAATAHTDDEAVDRFAAAMKVKMATARAKGRGGWEDKADCPAERLQAMMADHFAKGDPVDVGNFAMMLFNRGEPTAAPAPSAKQEPKLDDSEQYRLQMAAISTAALGYWKESDGINPEYDTVALRDVAKLYAKYEAIAAPSASASPAAPTDPWKWFADKAIDVLQRHIVPDGLSDHAALTELYGIFDGPEMRAMGTIPQMDCDARQAQAMREDRQVAMLAASPAAAVAAPVPAPVAGSQHVPAGWKTVMQGLLEIVEARNSQGGGLRLNTEGQSRVDAAKAFLLAAAAPAVPVPVEPQWQPMETAPKDGTMLRLLVDFADNATEDGIEPCPTIGANNFANDGIDNWQFAGWNWQQDCFTEGVGVPVGWLPLLAAPSLQQPKEGGA